MRSFAFALIVMAFCLAGCGKSRQQEVREAIVQELESDPQGLFEAFHPIGEATSVKVHSVQVKRDGADAVFTIYWQGPIVEDGYTKVAAHYDADVQRWTQVQVLATNGITRGELGEVALGLGAGVAKALFDE